MGNTEGIQGEKQGTTITPIALNNTATNTTTTPPRELSIAEIVRNIDLNNNYTQALSELEDISASGDVRVMNSLLEQLNSVIESASGELSRFNMKNTTIFNYSEINNLIRYTEQKTKKIVVPVVDKKLGQKLDTHDKQQLHHLYDQVCDLGDELRTSLPSLVYQQITILG